MKDRILWLDNLKGFLIFMVVLGHTILFTNNDGDSNIFYRYISSFWMALFMFTSGFACYKVRPSYKLIWKRFKQLIIPFICWSFILSNINRSNNIIYLLLYPSKSVWFLWALFFINSIVVIVCNIAHSYRMSEEKLCFIIIVVLFILNKEVYDNNIFALNLICLHFVNFVVGYFSRKHFDSISKLPHVVFYGCGLAFLLMAYFNNGSFVPFGLPSSLHVFYSILCGFLSFPLFTSLFMKVKFPILLSRIGGGNFRYLCGPYRNIYYN